MQFESTGILQTLIYLDCSSCYGGFHGNGILA